MKIPRNKPIDNRSRPQQEERADVLREEPSCDLDDEARREIKLDGLETYEPQETADERSERRGNARRDLLPFLKLVANRYDYFGGLIETERPILVEIHDFVAAVAMNRKPPVDFLIDLATALTVFLEKGNLDHQLKRFSAAFSLTGKKGRKRPVQGEPIYEVRLAKKMMDLIAQGNTIAGAADILQQTLYPNDDALSKERSLERWYYSHHRWLEYMYATRDEMRAAEAAAPKRSAKSRPRKGEDLCAKFRKNIEDYIAAVERGT